MCIIVHKPADQRLTETQVVDFWSRNKDGWGVLFMKEGKLHHAKGLDLDSFWKCVRRNNKRELLVHARYRTHGDVTIEQCHPFEVLSRDERGGPLYVMHNGVISIDTAADPTKSDTWHFIHEVLRPILRKAPSVLRARPFREMLAEHVGGNNKLAFMDGTGEVTLINRRTGVEHDGCWYSNTYAWSAPRPVYVGPKYTYVDGRWTGEFEGKQGALRLLPGRRDDEVIADAEVSTDQEVTVTRLANMQQAYLTELARRRRAVDIIHDADCPGCGATLGRNAGSCAECAEFADAVAREDPLCRKCRADVCVCGATGSA